MRSSEHSVAVAEARGKILHVTNVWHRLQSMSKYPTMKPGAKGAHSSAHIVVVVVDGGGAHRRSGSSVKKPIFFLYRKQTNGASIFDFTMLVWWMSWLVG